MDPWKKIEENFTKIVGFSPIKVTPNTNGLQVMVLINKIVFAILKLSEDEKTVDIFFRASILPNAAAFIATIVGHIYQININQNFDYDLDGNRLIGKDAIEFSAVAGRIAWSAVDHTNDGCKDIIMGNDSLN